MIHRLWHSLVVSSVVLLEGCSFSHEPQLDATPGGDGGRPPDDAEPPRRDGGWLDDAGRLRDAGALRDAWFAHDAGVDASGDDASVDDASVDGDAGADPYCENGWPPTKGFWCVLQDGGETVCCDITIEPDGGMAECCVLPEATP